MTAPPSRGRFRFSLRTFFVACLIAVLAAGWWADRSRLKAEFESRHDIRIKDKKWEYRATELQNYLQARGTTVTWIGDEYFSIGDPPDIEKMPED